MNNISNANENSLGWNQEHDGGHILNIDSVLNQLNQYHVTDQGEYEEEEGEAEIEEELEDEMGEEGIINI